MKVIEAAPECGNPVDESYFDFSGQTMTNQIGKLPNLFIARTFSKAYGLLPVCAWAYWPAMRQNVPSIRRMVLL